MAGSVDNVRIDSIDPAQSQVFTGLRPVISWDYAEDVESPSQYGFRVLIGTADTDLGTPFFVGDILDETVESSVPYYEMPLDRLVRGTTYYGQVNAVDAADWETFSFKVNTLPGAVSAGISPSSPTPASSLRLSYSYSDADAHAEGATRIRWFKNNVHQPQLNELLEVEASNLSEGDTWHATVTPHDGLEYGATSETSVITVAASDVELADVRIEPAEPNSDDILYAHWEIPEDPYVDLTSATHLS